MTVTTHASRKVRKPDIAHHWDKLHKKPGYNPFE